jgi:hypothetical protein
MMKVVARAGGAGTRRRREWIALLLMIAAVTAVLTVTTPGLQDPPANAARIDTSACAPGVDLFGFSDRLDKKTFDGTNVGGSSGLTYDASRDVYYGLVDNEGTTPARFCTLRP